MKERPILFSAPMVCAILEGRKTVTRRVVKPQPAPRQGMVNAAYCGRPELWLPEGNIAEGDPGSWKCPYGQPGDRLYVRESFMVVGYGGFSQSTSTGYESFETIGVEFAAGGDPSTFDFLNGKPVEGTPASVDYAMASRMADSGPEGNRPSIHMPRWASRITLEVTGVRVERLQDISSADILAEGVQIPVDAAGNQLIDVSTKHGPSYFIPPGKFHDHAARLFGHWAALWVDINGIDSWNANPWVWVVEFKRVTS
jgi:hypothetical protein